MGGDIETVRTIAGAPLRTVRLAQLTDIVANPGRTMDRLVGRGAVLRLARGVYTAPPDGRDARTWRPALETAGLAVATARFGNRNAILMGLGAARHWAAIPRGIGVTTVAVPVAGRPAIELDTGGVVHFIPRDLDRIDATLEPTELGQALVTTPAQTLYDLLMKPNQGGEPALAREAADNLVPRVHADDYRDVLDAAGRAGNAARAVLARLTGGADR